jgi:alkylation response protein AidB-like acyl-CoA dehydrogenase
MAPAALASEDLRRATQSVAERAAALDAGTTDVRTDIAALGGAGLLDAGLGSDSLEEITAVIEEVSGASLAVGFCTWAQRMALEYVYRAGPTLRERHLPSLRGGQRVGVTAMAAALQQVAGLGEVPIVAENAQGGLRVDGPIRWASNVFHDSLIVFPARAVDNGGYVAAVSADRAGLTINPPPSLMALNATASTSLRIEKVHVGDDEVISTDLTGFVRGIRPTFLILQTAFCLGISGSALDAAESLLTGTGLGFAEEVIEARNELRHLRERTYGFARQPSHAPLVELIRLRLAASTAAMTATRLESTMSGGRGYVIGSPANIRLREAAFLPIQSPSEGQLRWELTQYE